MKRRKVILIWDRWRVHRSAATILQERYPDRLDIEWLPAYAPELHPTEQIWNHTKYGDLANFIPDHLNDLTDAVMISITAQHHDNDLIRGFFEYVQLEL
jgi:transposase